MPREQIEKDSYDFDIALQDLDYVSHKAKLIHKIEVISRSLPMANRMQKIKLQQEILVLQDKIRQIESVHFESRS